MSQSRRVAVPNAVAGAGLVLTGAVLIQLSAALVKPVLGDIGPSAASSWRFLLGAIVLLCVARPRLRSFTRHQWLGALALGATIAFMNQCFYHALARIPLGGAVAIEYLGPLLVAALGKRTARHLGFVVLAGLGVVALTRPGGGLTFAGVLFAAGAGLGWASYMFAARRVGTTTEGLQGLAVSIAISAILTLPFSIASAHTLVDRPYVLGRIFIVSMLAIVLGFGVELQALRRLRPSVVSVLLALDPAVAFVIGWLILSQGVTAWDGVGLACIVAAGVGVTYDATSEEVALAR